MKVFIFVFVAILTMAFSSVSQAARILSGSYDPNLKVVNLIIAYEGGCEEPEFYINWTECGLDKKLQKKYLFGLLLSKQDVVACGQNIEQEIEFDISQINCAPEMIYLKSTSSKAPFVISK